MINENKNGLIDLHTHSSYSDGDLTPVDLVKLAKFRGLSTISITDHDTLLGNKNLFHDNFSLLNDINVIPGIELSAKDDIGRMHILGYGINIDSLDLNNKMKELRDNSVNSVVSIVEQIKKDYGIIFTYEELRELINANHNLGRPDIAKLCVKKGYAYNVQDAFDKYLIPAYSKINAYKKGIHYNECIDLILKSGGSPVLAHPNTLKRSYMELIKLIREMMNFGLIGLEVYHSNHTHEETQKYLEIANKLNLLISGGTDFHGQTVKPDIELGTGKNNNIRIRHLSIFERLEK